MLELADATGTLTMLPKVLTEPASASAASEDFVMRFIKAPLVIKSIRPTWVPMVQVPIVGSHLAAMNLRIHGSWHAPLASIDTLPMDSLSTQSFYTVNLYDEHFSTLRIFLYKFR